MPDQEPTPTGTLAERITHLFETVHPSDRGPYSNPEAADAINAQAGEHVLSATYLWQLRTGKRDDPTHSRLTAIARFFGVGVDYFYDDETARRTNEQLELASALAVPLIAELALAASGLSEPTLRSLLDMTRSARLIEGLDTGDSRA
ncbi:helix-turn-helix domain-containing protein [Kitasatospora phosalacinea]|uniref:XRE family transcriptional regulator n=1 Tax=Kitasatospora phosalacinea TaxID=2065 RepID=A0A9W6UK39_9ACTN|nr:helix-turn-helix domain-containing protein [Kitasatospora phosalacinea]GLW53036.1 XRE family transcriptional regulator [Kitasatospora phosalacinea]